MTLLAQLGLRLASPWVRPGRFWLSWPAGRGPEAEEDCLGLAETLSDFAPVTLVCRPADVPLVALRTSPDISALACEHDFPGTAPLFLADLQGGLAGAWGGGGMAEAMAGQAGIPLYGQPPFPAAAEFQVDGDGMALVARNWAERHRLEPERAAELLCGGLGLRQVIWLERPGAARFLAPGLVAAGSPETAESVDRAGPFTVLNLPQPRNGRGSYADCLVAGRLVVMPEYEDARDADAYALLSAALPGARVLSVPASFCGAPGRIAVAVPDRAQA